MQCRESSKDVRKLWLVICCHFIIFYLSLRFVLIHPRVHLWGGQMREAFSANLERWSFAWFRLWAPGKLRACFLLRAKSTTCYIHTRTWTDCSIMFYTYILITYVCTLYRKACVDACACMCNYIRIQSHSCVLIHTVYCSTAHGIACGIFCCHYAWCHFHICLPITAYLARKLPTMQQMPGSAPRALALWDIMACQYLPCCHVERQEFHRKEFQWGRWGGCWTHIEALWDSGCLHVYVIIVIHMNLEHLFVCVYLFGCVCVCVHPSIVLSVYYLALSTSPIYPSM